ncbi:DNA cytosine methyltransferase [Desulfofundulus sp.]|uniref:DNA cytosine methyltransferase n=1 Tax=Desulfofundulus sp. TaxID=2282750 RepID=UPI003C75A5C3
MVGVRPRVTAGRRNANAMRVLDLFSGIGGFALGLERAGMTTAAFCEIDSYRRSVLKKHWPHVPVFGDVRELTREKLIEAGVIDNEAGRTIDLICGGPPCQPFSVAGKRRGTADDRYLWPEMFRIIREVRPPWVLFENVANIVNMALDTVLSDLETEGYETGTLIIPACAVGAPHRRDRVWVVAHSAGMERQSGAEEQGVLRRVPADGEECNNTGRSGKTQSGDNVAHAEGTGLPERRHRPGENGCETGEKEENSSITRPAGCCLLLGKTAGARDAQPRLGRVLDGLSGRLDNHRWPAPFGCPQYDWEPPRLAQGEIPYRRQRLMALGDAVVPQVVEAIGRAIIAANSFRTVHPL